MTSRPATLGQLKESGWESVPVKEELRRNAIAKVAAGEERDDEPGDRGDGEHRHEPPDVRGAALPHPDTVPP